MLKACVLCCKSESNNRLFGFINLLIKWCNCTATSGCLCKGPDWNSIESTKDFTLLEALLGDLNWSLSWKNKIKQKKDKKYIQ